MEVLVSAKKNESSGESDVVTHCLLWQSCPNRGQDEPWMSTLWLPKEKAYGDIRDWNREWSEHRKHDSRLDYRKSPMTISEHVWQQNDVRLESSSSSLGRSPRLLWEKLGWGFWSHRGVYRRRSAVDLSASKQRKIRRGDIRAVFPVSYRFSGMIHCYILFEIVDCR